MLSHSFFKRQLINNSKQIRQQLQLQNMINKNSRNSIDERNKARSEKANINIQINFNMKDKAQGFSGKKIDNYVEIEQKPTIRAEANMKQTDQAKKTKKKNLETIDRAEKDKIFQTPNKQRLTDVNKASKNLKQEKTPQRRSIQRKQERSKSTNQKLVKRKNGKSVENIRAGLKQIRKQFSPAHSAQKSRSHSKSSKKLLKSSQTSLKNIFVFSNSGINNKLKKSREKISSKKATIEDPDKIKKFMQEKKKKEKADKLRQIKQQKLKKEKRASQLKKVQAERKANASKPIPYQKKLIQQKQQRFPIFFDDEEFDESNQYDNLRRQAEKLVHESPTPKETIETIPIPKAKGFDFDKHGSSSSKKTHKKHTHTPLVQKYLNGTITEKQFHHFEKLVIKIQSFWRGYFARKQFAKKLYDQSTKIRYIKNKIQTKKAPFWNDEENSIINLQKNSNIKIDESIGSQDYINYNSNANSNLSQNSGNSRLISTKGDRYKKLSIQLEEQEAENLKNQKAKLQNEQAAKMAKQIEELRKMIQQQNEKYRSLEEENINLKNNIKVLGQKEVKQDLIASNDFIEIRMPKKIESPKPVINERKKSQIRHLEINKQINLNVQPEQQIQKPVIDLNSFKKQFQAYECSSPSNAMLQQQLRSLKNKNIQGIFLKKQIQMKQKYEKKYIMFDKMLNDRLFSPRTYNMKKKELEVNLQSQILEIKNRREEAKRVVGFIADLSQDNIEASQEQSLRTASIGIKEDVNFNFKKEKQVEPIKVLKDNFTNTTPTEIKQSEFKGSKELKKQKKHAQHESNSSYSSEEEHQYKKYWTDDVQQVHTYAMNTVKKIEEAIKADKSDSSSQYNSIGHEKQQQFIESNKKQARNHMYSKSGDCNVNLQTLKQSYEDYLQEEIPSENQRKAKQIFNKIDLSDCKSEQDLESSHQNICRLLNTRVFHDVHAHGEIKEVENLYISEAEFNKKRKEDELSRSNSFQKSNKSLSVNNSQLQVKGFITNLTFIKEFCISVCEYIRNNDSFKEQFVQNISQTIKYDFCEYLKSYRITLGGEIKNNFNTYTDEYLYHYFKSVSSKDQAISHELFNNFLRAYDEEKIHSADWTNPGKNKEVKEMREYFLISIIDSFNESLQFEKPGGIYGEPFPWMNNSNKLKNHSHTKIKFHSKNPTQDSQDEAEEDKELDQIFGSSIAKIIQWGSFLCGFIADPMPMEMGDSQIANLSDEQLSSIRENRIGLMLQKWLLEQEQKIINSTSEYTEVLLNLSEKITQMLILQCSQEMEEI